MSLYPTNMMAYALNPQAGLNSWGQPGRGYSYGRGGAPQPPERQSLRIVYYNDPHEKFAAMPHMITGFRHQSWIGAQRGQDVLRLCGGDNNIGEETREWFLNVALMNLLQLHGTAMGNHELDQGSRSMSSGLLNANFPTLLSNMNITPNSSFHKLAQLGRIQTRQSLVPGRYGYYGLIGVTTPELDEVLDTDVNLEGMSEKEFDDTIIIVQQQVNDLLRNGVNRIIVLSHMGYELEVALAKAVSGIDVVVGGHSHDILPGVMAEGEKENPFAINRREHKPNWIMGPTGEPVVIVQAGKDGRLFGTLDLNWNARGQISGVENKLHRVFSYFSDPQGVALMDRTLGPPKRLAWMTVDYANHNIPFQEDPVAEFAADAARKLSNADIAFVRSPEIRNDIHPGVFTDLDLKALMPFSDPLIRLSLTGEEIMEGLERSAESLKERDPHPGMLHPSGMGFVMNERTGEVESAHVQSRDGKWERLDEDKTYSVAMGEFTIDNGKEFPEFAHPDRIDWRSDKPLRQVFLWGLQQAGAPSAPISFETDGRIQIVS